MNKQSFRRLSKLFYDGAFANADKIEFVKKCQDGEMILYRFNKCNIDSSQSSYIPLKVARNTYDKIIASLKQNDNPKIGIIYEEIEEVKADRNILQIKHRKHECFDDLYITQNDFEILFKIKNLNTNHEHVTSANSLLGLPPDGSFEAIAFANCEPPKYERDKEKIIAKLKIMYLTVVKIHEQSSIACTKTNVSKKMHQLLQKNKCLGLDASLRSERNRSIASKKKPFKNIRIRKGTLLPEDTNYPHCKELCEQFLPQILRLKHC